jgi:hypothetical protein
MTAIDCGFGAEATAERLLEESEKARIKGRGYARQTARNAQSEVEKNRQGRGGAVHDGRAIVIVRELRFSHQNHAPRHASPKIDARALNLAL